MTRILTSPVSAPDRGGLTVPVEKFDSADELFFSAEPGALRYEVRLDERGTLDALMVDKGSRALVVVFHGAMVKGHHHLPRFEWLRTLDEQTKYSCLFLSDPTLTLDPELLLSWYLGWEELDLFPVLSEVVMKAAKAAGAERIILTGSSGGAFAALQVGSLLPGSLAIAFNSQTAIRKYHWDAQASFLHRIMPDLYPKKRSRRSRWAKVLGERASVIQRYEAPRQNYALVVQNVRDEHHYEHHYLPFAAAVQDGPNAERIVFEEYSAGPFHEPPGRERFVGTIRRGIRMLDEWAT